MKAGSPAPTRFQGSQFLLTLWICIAGLLTVTPAYGALEYLNQTVSLSPNLGYRPRSLIEGADGSLISGAIRSPAQSALVSFNRDGTGFTVLHEFGSVPEDGDSIQTPELFRGQDGFLYGFIFDGGTNDSGMIFRLKPDGAGYQVLHTFPAVQEQAGGGAFPNCLVVDSATAKLYGAAAGGLNSQPGLGRLGLLFKLGTDGTGFTVLKHFPAEVSPSPRYPSRLLKGSDGLLYGVGEFGSDFEGTFDHLVFKLGTDGTGVSVVANPTPRFKAFSSLFESVGGKLYGTTVRGGSHGQGIAFGMNKDGTGLTTLFHFDNVSPGVWFEGADAGLYGAYGTAAFRLNASTGASAKLATIPGRIYAMVEGADGALYGTSLNTEVEPLKVFRLAPLPTGAPRIFSRGMELTESSVQFFGTRTLALTSSIPNAEIFYTTDGSAPTSASQPYVVPFEVAQDTLLRVVVYSDSLPKPVERPALDIRVTPAWTLTVNWSGGPATVGYSPPPVDVVRSGNGPSPAQAIFPVGTQVRVTLRPDDRYRFKQWSSGAVGSDPEVTVTLNSDVTLIAVVESKPTYYVHTFTRGGGRITGNGPTPAKDVNNPYLWGQRLTLEPVPQLGWVFLGWRGAITSSVPSQNVLIDATKSYEAVFGAEVKATKIGAGTLEILPGPGPHPYGTPLLAVARPETGFFLALWNGHANGTFSPLAFSLTNEADFPQLIGTFTVVPAGLVRLDADIRGSGFITASPARNTFVPGQTVSLTATPGAGERFYHWSWTGPAGEHHDTNRLLTLTVTSNTAVAAVFSPAIIPPRLLRLPAAVTVLQGYPAQFSVAAEGSAPLSYRWRRGGLVLDESAVYQGTTKSNLQVNFTGPSTAGDFSVTVTNEAGSVTSPPVRLTILDGLADTDGDGLRNADEGLLGTNPTLVDTDGDGLNDFREARELGTNPLAADTDGDGFADGTEVAAGTDPKNAAESPDGQLTAYFAIELEFFTLIGKNYQLQQSTDLQTWTNVGVVFAGTGNVASRFVSTRTNDQTYWRLVPVP